MTERHLNYSETLSNGCQIKVRSEILRDGSLKMFIGIYKPDGSVIVEDNDLAPDGLDMEDAFEWGSTGPRRLATGRRFNDRSCRVLNKPVMTENQGKLAGRGTEWMQEHVQVERPGAGTDRFGPAAQSVFLL